MSKAHVLLKRIQEAQRRVEAAERKEMLCRSLAEKVTASMDTELVSGTRNVTAHEERIIRLMQAAEETEMAMQQMEELIDELREKLTQLESPDGGTILYLRYIDKMKIKEIAKIVFCSNRHVYRKMETALAELDKLLRSDKITETE